MMMVVMIVVMVLLMDEKDGKHDRGDCFCNVMYVAILVTVSFCTHFGKLFDDSDF